MSAEERRQAEKVSQSINALVEKSVRVLAVNVTSRLTGDTPRDTGWAASNWIPTLSEPRTTPAGTRADAEEGILPVEEQQEGLADVLRFRLSDGYAFIANNVPYIRDLNDGSSRKAPAGFVQIAIHDSLVELPEVL